MGIKILGFLLTGFAVLLLFVVLYRNSTKSDVPLIFSPTQVLNATWIAYKKGYIEEGSNRTLDKQRENITTSEGEGYTMLRAVWLGDKSTFDASWKWTRQYLQHTQGDRLFSWLYGKNNSGGWGVLTEKGGGASASDADTDIALALVFAYARWQDPSYLSEAQAIISDIWDHDVIEIQGTPYLTADNFEKNSQSPFAVINPSYLSPGAYRIFAKVDPTHPWLLLVDSSYVLLERSMDASLDVSKSAGLPPDWLLMDKKTGALSAPEGGTNTTNFSFDALRIPWRIALDAQWFEEKRAAEALGRMSFLKEKWKRQGKLSTAYKHDGTVVDEKETPAMYAGTLGYFMLTDPKLAEEIYKNKLQYLYNPDTNAWREPLSYYDDNLAWFAIAQYNRLLPNLAEDLPSSAFR